LIQTKSTQQDSPTRHPIYQQDDAKWIKKVVQQEHIKPLEVSKDYVLEFERREKENADRLTSQVDRHISTLKKLRVKLESRHELKARSDEYRQWERGFIPKKQAVMIGKTIAEFESQNRPLVDTYDPDSEIDDKAMKKVLNKGNRNQQSSQELSTVLDSLNRLAEVSYLILSSSSFSSILYVVCFDNISTQFHWHARILDGYYGHSQSVVILIILPTHSYGLFSMPSSLFC
jgi:hypothetical protein